MGKKELHSPPYQERHKSLTFVYNDAVLGLHYLKICIVSFTGVLTPTDRNSTTLMYNNVIVAVR